MTAAAIACVSAASADAASLSENFDGPAAPGWLQKNNSTSPPQAGGWGFGNAGVFNAYNGAPGTYLAATHSSTTAASGATISAWLMTPGLYGLSTGDTISFYTRKVSANFPDRLEVRMSTNGSCDPGTSATDVGDFPTLLLTINPSLTTTGYPVVWTRYAVTLPQMTPGRGCIAFRYHVTNAGSDAPNSDYIGIDQVDVVDRDGDITPDTTIAAGPSATVGPDGAAFTYAGTPSEGIASYECRLMSVSDEDPEFTPCPTSGHGYEGLAEDDYTFEVRAVSVDGNVDPSPAKRSFTVDATAPDTSITGGPRGLTRDASPLFTYGGSPSEDVDRFECRLTATGATAASFASCPDAGRQYEALADGDYTFEVRAVDAVGNADPSPASQAFAVDATAPTTAITVAPNAVITDGAATFAFATTPDDSSATFECRLNGTTEATFESCPGGTKSYTGLADGTYVFEVRATDVAGNVEATPATRTFTVAAPLTPPGPPDPTVDPPAAPPSNPSPPGPPLNPSSPGPPATAPRLSNVRLTRTSFRAWTSGSGFGQPKRMRTTGGRGSWLRLKVDRPARLELRVSRAKGRGWTRLKGSEKATANAKTTRIPVRGRFRGKTLRTGRYRLTVVAVDRATGARTTKHVRFRIRG